MRWTEYSAPNKIVLLIAAHGTHTKLRSSWAGMRPHEKIGRRTTHAG